MSIKKKKRQQYEFDTQLFSFSSYLIIFKMKYRHFIGEYFKFDKNITLHAWACSRGLIGLSVIIESAVALSM